MSACSLVGYPAGGPAGATPGPAGKQSYGSEPPGTDAESSGATVRDVGDDPGNEPDARPVQEAKSRYGNPSEYEVRGVRYRVLETSTGYEEEGLASWYGEEFQGRRTSSGEPYDMYRMTAAHRSLPLPTYVEVTNLENGRRIVVRVNDRGPFHPDRIIDLSFVAARRLGFTGAGTARVRVRALEPAAR